MALHLTIDSREDRLMVVVHHLAATIAMILSVVSAPAEPIQGDIVAQGKEQRVDTIELQTIEGEPTTLGAHKGKVVLLVNVASACGYTPQYEGLEALYRELKDDGLVVIGVPCNDFGGQEPGSDKEILEFCTGKFDVTFPMMSKVKVLGDDAHPLYLALRSMDAPIGGPVRWNFTKFVIDQDGKVVGRYEPDAKPDSKVLRAQIDALLGSETAG